MTEFITTPTEEWLKGALVRCKSQLLISSPYVGGWLPKLHHALPVPVRRVLLTRADMRDFASGASDLEAVCTLAGDGTEIISAHRLHAKVYVIDDSCGLVTSANATLSGMRSNLECGVVLSDPQSVQVAAELILRAFGSHEIPQRWSVSELQSLREPVRRLQETLSPKLLTEDIGARLLADVRPDTSLGRTLREHLPGWTCLALEGVQMQRSAIFSLDVFVSACMPLVSKRYPKNKNVRAKLRQQLQRLRDLGIIEFLGGGTYRRNG